ncbi:hypothetical protein OG689_26980 [Kitasatospora sp. NBC_00240]|uniref:hypothetical protein n=1 Tax=Kitasatospora sp. NBC_00240 TaxID=2903567 RepID=UPI00224F2808|nr:hypothetical protein [Kitasatospora sp. NBC_00240]MCX5212874.1 hypothetical protein [Kitasatospora sp. NBC_00240]
MGRSEPSGIGAARLEQLFDTLRSEVTTTVQPPLAAQVVRSAAGRRRRRRGTALGVGCALMAAALLAVPRLAPVGGTGPAGAPEADRTLRAELPLPGSVGPGAEPSAPGLPVTQSSPTWTGFAESQLFLPEAELPKVAGAYGPWDMVPEDPEADGSGAGAGRSAMCLTRGVGSAGAVRVEERSFTDRAGRSATAAQYLLVFTSAQSAERAGALLLDPLNCGSGERGWTASCSFEAVAVRDAGGLEEITVQRVGARLLALAVRQDAGEDPGPALVRPEFEAAAVALDARVDPYTSRVDGLSGPAPVPASVPATAAAAGQAGGRSVAPSGLATPSASPAASGSPREPSGSSGSTDVHARLDCPTAAQSAPPG